MYVLHSWLNRLIDWLIDGRDCGECRYVRAQVSYTFCCDFLSLLMKSAGSLDEFGPTDVVVQGLKKVRVQCRTFLDT